MSKKELTTKTGKPMCVYTLRDESGSLSVTAFDKALRNSEHNVGDMILIRGTANSWNGEVNLIMNRAWLAIRPSPSV
jgi:DNA polymerase III alpha subunit